MWMYRARGLSFYGMKEGSLFRLFQLNGYGRLFQSLTVGCDLQFSFYLSGFNDGHCTAFPRFAPAVGIGGFYGR